VVVSTHQGSAVVGAGFPCMDVDKWREKGLVAIACD